MTQEVLFRDMGLVGYQEAWDFQESILQANVSIKSTVRDMRNEPESGYAGTLPATTHYLLFCEHPPVYTLGKSGKMEHVLLNETQLQEKNIAFFRTNRGGDITFHGPGQVVGYPVFDLERFYTDIGRYLRELEEVIILTLASFGITGQRSKGETGVWIDPDIPGRERKICAMGVRCSRWVTMHGFALNVNTDLGFFGNIVPCGIVNKQVTSIEKELGYRVDINEVKELLLKNFERVFGVSIQPWPNT